ncbi:hypothetical protein EUGRSUZ_J02542 [Eucalyptus grandis]|uniref:Uncharacterized protein n=2 Tax=Eucalyptus grandis TaxID=71139 RepID=A0ACC3J8Y6_EUCGR|nr:hypothetical protein EUGRSUZ_J02542 [Eucalyptus grandis]
MKEIQPFFSLNKATHYTFKYCKLHISYHKHALLSWVKITWHRKTFKQQGISQKTALAVSNSRMHSSTLSYKHRR